MCNCLDYCMFAMVTIAFAVGTVRTWDLGVVTQNQIQFLEKKVVENTVTNHLQDMGAAAYDPVSGDVYVSAENQKLGSIFRIKTTGDTAYATVEPIVAKQSENVMGMAFDYLTSTLYWTTGLGRTINHLQVPRNGIKVPLAGSVLLNLEQQIPHSIAIDACRGYLYWTNSKNLNATIERSRLDGTDRMVVVRDELYKPTGIAVDAEHGRLYWSNKRGQMYYSIESSDLDGRSKKVLLHGTHHLPFGIALDRRNVYWSDWTNQAVWSVARSPSGNETVQQATMVVVYDKLNSPRGLITWPGNETTLPNNTECAMHRAQDIMKTTTSTTTFPTTIEVLKEICVHGVLHANGTCTCNPNFDGVYCQTAVNVCDGYCVTGTCIIDRSGLPTCQCPETNTGNRCERIVCARCQNGGECITDAAGNPRCDCPVGYEGDLCQYKAHWLMELCSAYCQHPMSKPQPLSICSKCDEYNRDIDIIHNSELSSCKISKSTMCVLAVLVVFIVVLSIVTLFLARKVRMLGRRPRIKKRIVVNKSITPRTPLQACKPPQQQNHQCEITIENCCNMNICETPCFEPDFRSPKLGGLLSSKSKKEDKANLLSNTDMSSEDEKPSY